VELVNAVITLGFYKTWGFCLTSWDNTSFSRSQLHRKLSVITVRPEQGHTQRGCGAFVLQPPKFNTK